MQPVPEMVKYSPGRTVVAERAGAGNGLADALGANARTAAALPVNTVDRRRGGIGRSTDLPLGPVRQFRTCSAPF
jgi:hypothetical protein